VKYSHNITKKIIHMASLTAILFIHYGSNADVFVKSQTLKTEKLK